MMEQRGSNFPSEPLTLLKNTKLEGDVSDLGLNILECVWLHKQQTQSPE